jgi:integrase
MASIHKDPRGRSPFWYCAYTTPDCKRRFKSTKLTDRKAALQFCHRLELASSEAKAGRLTPGRAHELIGEILSAATGEPLRYYTAQDWFNEWLSGKQATKAKATWQSYANVVGNFLASLGPRAKLNINQIVPRDVMRFRDAQIFEGKDPGTANAHAVVVRMAFTAARRQGLITHNPAEALERLPEDSFPTRRPFTVKEVNALVKAAEGDWKGAIMFGYYTGARLSDIARMRWESIDLEEKLIRFTPSKTRKPLELPLHPVLERQLLKRPGIAKAFLFPSLAATKGTGGRYGLSGQFKAIMDKAGVNGSVTRERKGKGGRTTYSLSFHSFRHTLTSLLANEGVAEETRMKLTGHKQRDIHAGYTHLERATLRRALEKLPAV